LGADLALEQPLLSFQIRANYRHHQAHVYVISDKPVREDKYAAVSIRVGRQQALDTVTPAAATPSRASASGDPIGATQPHKVGSTPGGYFEALHSLSEKLKAESELVILFDDSFKGDQLRKLVDFGESLGIPVRYIPLVDYSNSRGAIDMGL